MKKYVKIIMATMVVMSMALAVGCSKPAETPAPVPEGTPVTEGDKKVLIMATNAEFPPYEYYDNQKIVGIDIDIMEAVAESMGMTLQVEDMAFDAVIPSVMSGKADIGVAGMTVTPERLETIDFTDTYVNASQAIIVKVDNTEIVNADGLAGKTVGVQLGTTGDLYVTDVAGTVERYNKGFEAVQALTTGKIDAVVIDDQVAKAFAAENADVKVLDEPFTTEEYAIAIKKGNTELVESMNKALADLKESGKLAEIVGKYITVE